MALTTINSDGIKNDSIKNIDIKSDAAVEASKLDNPLQFPDDHKISFGTDGTGDLEIHHDGDRSKITDTGTGDLQIGGSQVGFTNAAHDNWLLKAIAGGTVELYWNNSKKLQTNSSGIQPFGNVDIQSGGNLYLENNGTIGLGNSQDLQAFHNGTNAFLDNNTGDLYIQTTGSGDDIIIESLDNISLKVHGSEDGINITGDGAVQLYYNGVEKFATGSAGIWVTGNIAAGDNSEVQLGEGSDLILRHNGANSFIENKTGNLILRPNTDENGLILRAGDAAELYHNNIKTFETMAAGCKSNIAGSNTFTIGSTDASGVTLVLDGDSNGDGAGTDYCHFHHGTDGDLSIHADNPAGDSQFELYVGSGDNTAIIAQAAGEVQLYHDGTAKFMTKPWGAYLDGGLKLNTDTDKLYIGVHEDIEIYHDGSQTSSYIDCSNSHLFIRNNVDADAGGDIRIQAKSGEDSIYCMHDGSVYLYYDGGSSKFMTTSWGTKTTGMHFAIADVASDYAIQLKNDGDNSNRYGLRVECGADDASGTNYAITIEDGNGGNQGYITFSGGTMSYGAFTAHHPCVVPDADNPSDSSNAYPYGTLLETIDIEYTQKNGSDTERGIIYKVQKTQSANSKKVLGAYGSSMNGGPDGQTNEHQALVLGDGHILVNNAGGNIEIGDGICSSATAGIGQKATANPSMIIGIAQENITFTGSETKLVAVQYGLQQFTPWS